MNEHEEHTGLIFNRKPYEERYVYKMQFNVDDDVEGW
jgi:hypothetical protein